MFEAGIGGYMMLKPGWCRCSCGQGLTSLATKSLLQKSDNQLWPTVGHRKLGYLLRSNGLECKTGSLHANIICKWTFEAGQDKKLCLCGLKWSSILQQKARVQSKFCSLFLPSAGQKPAGYFYTKKTGSPTEPAMEVTVLMPSTKVGRWLASPTFLSFSNTSRFDAGLVAGTCWHW